MQYKSALGWIISVAIFCCLLSTVSAGTPCRPMPSSPDDCCKAPKHEREAEVKEECVKMYGEQTTRERADKNARQRGCCIGECIVNGTGHAEMTEANMVEQDLQEADAMGMLADWEPVIKAAAKTCANELMKNADRMEEGFKLPPVDPKDTVCHPKYVFSLVCTNREYLMNCPAKYYSDSEECQALKEHFATCELY